MQPIIIQINKPIKDLHAVEHDINTRFPIFQFKDGMKSIDLTSHTVRIYGKNQQLNTFFNDLEIVNAEQGIAKLELTDTMMIEGTTQMQFVIMPNGGGQLKSHIFNLVNGKSLVDSNAIEGSNEYKVFEEALIKLETLITTGTELNQGLETNVTEGTAIKNQLDANIQTATTKNSELKKTTETANTSNATLIKTTEQANATKRELDQSIATGDISTIVNRIASLEQKGIKTLWSGSVQNKNETIALSEDLNNFDKLLVTYTFAGTMQDFIDLKSNTEAKILTGNLTNADTGATYSILELELQKTNNTTLTLTVNKEVVNGSTVNLNVGYITKIEGIKF